jgi:hypothetical protein
MRSIKALPVLLALAATPLLAMPQAASAATSCSDDYWTCMNDGWENEGTLNDIDCGAGYIGCIGRKLKFW